MRRLRLVFLSLILVPLLSTTAFAGTATFPLKVFIISDPGSSLEVVVAQGLTSKMNSTKAKDGTSLFKTVESSADANFTVMIICTDETKPIACAYTSSYVGAETSTFLGGGIAHGTPTEISDYLLGSIAQDIAERWNSTDRTNMINNLEACLMLTQSSCAVPDTLVPELKMKIVNLSQYLQKGGLKK